MKEEDMNYIKTGVSIHQLKWATMNLAEGLLVLKERLAQLNLHVQTIKTQPKEEPEVIKKWLQYLNEENNQRKKETKELKEIMLQLIEEIKKPKEEIKDEE